MSISLESKALCWSVLAGLLALGSAALLAQTIRGEGPSPEGRRVAFDVSPAIEAEGRHYFLMSCSECHGDDATGDEGPDLHRLSLSNARIAATIKKGIKGEMPAFVKKYDDRQISSLVTYLRSLQ